MFPGWQQLLLVLVIALIFFGGRGRITSIMGDLAQGIRSFRKGLAEDAQEEADDKTTASLEAQETETVEVKAQETTKAE
ncbi:MAG: twin-arginine translocase TatA/TatE family subunit [Parvularculaceae bacterium]|nr:twin-arginine translocase TatA/TatE family subunit [Parvularculaceae bacterium]